MIATHRKIKGSGWASIYEEMDGLMITHPNLLPIRDRILGTGVERRVYAYACGIDLLYWKEVSLTSRKRGQELIARVLRECETYLDTFHK